MQGKYILTLILAVVLVIFTLQNTLSIEVDIFFWKVEASIALLVISIFLFGALSSAVFSVQTIVKKKRIIHELKHKIADQEKLLHANQAGKTSKEEQPAAKKPELTEQKNDKLP